MVNYDKLPLSAQGGMRRYIEDGIPPGGFLQAVLSDSLVEAYARADSENTERMRDYAAWLYSDCPRTAWGSQKIVQQWMEERESER